MSALIFGYTYTFQSATVDDESGVLRHSGTPGRLTLGSAGDANTGFRAVPPLDPERGNVSLEAVSPSGHFVTVGEPVGLLHPDADALMLQAASDDPAFRTAASLWIEPTVDGEDVTLRVNNAPSRTVFFKRVGAEVMTGKAYRGLCRWRVTGGPVLAWRYSFDGTGADVSIPDDPVIDFERDQDFTVALSVRAARAQRWLVNGDNEIVEKWSGPGGYPYVIRFINQRGGARWGKLLVARYDRSANPAITSSMRVDDGHFHHVAFVRRTEGGVGRLYLYIDGEQDGVTEDTTTASTRNDSPLYIGRRGGGNPNHFTGDVRGLEIHAEALPAERIARMAARAK